MKKPHLLLIAGALVAAFAIAVDAGAGDSIWISPPACSGSIAECMTEGEFEMDSETNRRMLAARGKLIGYGALNRGKTPCSHKGKSYYNCKAGKANPYSRPCSTITKCKHN